MPADDLESQKVSQKDEAPAPAAPAGKPAAPAKTAGKAAPADKIFVVKADRVLMVNGHHTKLTAGKRISQALYGGPAAIKQMVDAGVELEEVK